MRGFLVLFVPCKKPLSRVREITFHRPESFNNNPWYFGLQGSRAMLVSVLACNLGRKDSFRQFVGVPCKKDLCLMFWVPRDHLPVCRVMLLMSQIVSVWSLTPFGHSHVGSGQSIRTSVA